MKKYYTLVSKVRVGGFSGANEGYSILEMPTKKVVILGLCDIINIKRSGAVLYNFDVQNGEVVTTNGSISRYPYVEDKEEIYTILEAFTDNNVVVGYLVADKHGRVAKMSKNKLIELCNKIVASTQESQPIANGAFSGDFIRPISGNYITTDIGVTKAHQNSTPTSNNTEVFRKPLTDKDNKMFTLAKKCLKNFKANENVLAQEMKSNRNRVICISDKSIRDAQVVLGYCYRNRVLSPQLVNATANYYVLGQSNKLEDLKLADEFKGLCKFLKRNPA